MRDKKALRMFLVTQAGCARARILQRDCTDVSGHYALTNDAKRDIAIFLLAHTCTVDTFELWELSKAEKRVMLGALYAGGCPIPLSVDEQKIKRTAFAKTYTAFLKTVVNAYYK